MPTNSTVLLDSCSPGKSIFVRSRMIAPSWLKAVRTFADGDDVATRGLSIGLLATLGFIAPGLTTYGPPLIWLLVLQHRR
jgi:hypothetical protein